MRTYAPVYYSKFRCIAEKCLHNCCIGWEIDIDENTLCKYENMNDLFGKKICENIEYEVDTIHFRLNEDDRCPFLNDNNLCDIITNLGYDAICDICDEHPRFTNYYSESAEIGLGLCCEAAGEIILSQDGKFALECIEESGEFEDYELYGEKDFFNLRNHCFNILTDRSLPIAERFSHFAYVCQCKLPDKSIAEWVAVFENLEEMDKSKNEVLSDVAEYIKAGALQMHCENADIYMENLAIYFVYRHFAKYFEGIEIPALANFVILSCYAVVAMCNAKYEKTKKLEFADVVEFARMYSAEIEYSEDNTYALLEMLG